MSGIIKVGLSAEEQIILTYGQYGKALVLSGSFYFRAISVNIIYPTPRRDGSREVEALEAIDVEQLQR